MNQGPVSMGPLDNSQRKEGVLITVLGGVEQGIEMPLNVFANRADPGQAALVRAA